MSRKREMYSKKWKSEICWTQGLSCTHYTHPTRSIAHCHDTNSPSTVHDTF